MIDTSFLKDVGILVGVPVFRSVVGWASTALEDSKITEFEWKQLAQTIVRVGTMGFLGYVGLSVSGVDNAALSAVVGSYFVDKILNTIKKTKQN